VVSAPDCYWWDTAPSQAPPFDHVPPLWDTQSFVTDRRR